MSSQTPETTDSKISMLSPIIEAALLTFLLKGVQMFESIQSIAEKADATEHFWTAPQTRKRSERDDLEARAIVLAATMPKPSYGKIAKMLDVPKSTLSYWPNLKIAFDERYKRTGEARRGFRNADGSVEGFENADN